MSKIYQSLINILNKVEAIEKTRQGELKYAYRGIDDIYNSLSKLFAEFEVICIPEVLEKESTEREIIKKDFKTGIESKRIDRHVNLKVKYNFYASDGSSVFVITYGEAIDSSDKATNKAMSAAHKYALVQMFLIPTQDDNDTESSHHELASLKENKNSIQSNNKKLFNENKKPEDTTLFKKEIMNVARSKGYTPNDITSLIEQEFQIKSGDHLTIEQCKILLDYFNKAEPKKEK